MEKRLFLVGAGGLGREMEFWINLIPEAKRNYHISGYLDDNPEALANFPSDYELVGNIRDFRFQKSDMVLLCIANSLIKEEIFNNLKNKVEIFTFISPLAHVSKFSTIGQGSIITPNCLISTNVKIGDCVLINIGSQIGHDSSIGNFSSLMPNVDIGGNCKIGNHVFFGTNSALIPEKRVNDNIKIGAGSLIMSNLTKQGTYFGNPAKKIF